MRAVRARAVCAARATSEPAGHVGASASARLETSADVDAPSTTFPEKCRGRYTLHVTAQCHALQQDSMLGGGRGSPSPWPFTKVSEKSCAAERVRSKMSAWDEGVRACVRAWLCAHARLIRSCNAMRN